MPSECEGMNRNQCLSAPMVRAGRRKTLSSLDRALSIRFLPLYQLDNKDPTLGQALKISPEPHPAPAMVPSVLFQTPISGCSLGLVALGGLHHTHQCLTTSDVCWDSVFLSPKVPSPSARWVFFLFCGPVVAWRGQVTGQPVMWNQPPASWRGPCLPFFIFGEARS